VQLKYSLYSRVLVRSSISTVAKNCFAESAVWVGLSRLKTHLPAQRFWSYRRMSWRWLFIWHSRFLRPRRSWTFHLDTLMFFLGRTGRPKSHRP
jgi:hypothetical protein